MNDYIIQAWGCTSDGRGYHKDEHVNNETLANAERLMSERRASCKDGRITHFNLLVKRPHGLGFINTVTV